MADDVVVNGVPIRAIDVGGVKRQIVGIDLGGEGASVPVVGALPISATTLPLPTGAALDATLAAQSAKLPATLGQKAMAASMGVVLASDQPPVAVSSPGLSGGILPTWTAVGTTAVLLPATPFAGRATVLVQAWEGNTLPIFLGNSAITARVLGATPASTDGCPFLLASQSAEVPLAAAVLLYARATAAGQWIGTCELAA